MELISPMLSVESYLTFRAPEHQNIWLGPYLARMTLGWSWIGTGTVQLTMGRNYSGTSLLNQYPRLALKEMDSLPWPNTIRELMVVIATELSQIRIQSSGHCASGKTSTIMAYPSLQN